MPPWKGYEQMTPEEKDLVRSSFSSLGPNDEPPYPVGGLHAILRAAQRDLDPSTAGSVVHVVASVNASGSVESVQVRSAPNSSMGIRLAALLKKSAFKPARCQGEPCAMDFPLLLSIAP